MAKGWACVLRLGGIGDNLIAASPLHALKKLGYKTEVIAAPPAHVVYHHNPNIDKLTVKVPDRDLPQNDMVAWQMWMEARSHEYEIFANLSHSCEGRHAVFKSTTAFWWQPDYRRKYCAGSYLETAHDVLGVPHIFGPLYYVSEAERVIARSTKAQIGDRVIGWVLSGTRIDKVYPYSTYIIPRLIQELGVSVVLIGGRNPKEYSMAETIKEVTKMHIGNRNRLKSAVQSPDIPQEQVTSIRASLALLHQCDVVVSPDTGPAWSVAMEQIPKVIMVSHASVENITKHWVNTITLHADPDRVPCWPCHRLHDDPSTCVQNKEGNGAACISDISVDRLFRAIAEALSMAESIRFNKAYGFESPVVSVPGSEEQSVSDSG